MSKILIVSLIGELMIRIYTMLFLIVAICLMPHFTGVPIILFSNGSLMINTGCFLSQNIIPFDTVFLYGIVLTSALIYLTHDFLKWFQEVS